MTSGTKSLSRKEILNFCAQFLREHKKGYQGLITDPEKKTNTYYINALKLFENHQEVDNWLRSSKQIFENKKIPSEIITIDNRIVLFVIYL